MSLLGDPKQRQQRQQQQHQQNLKQWQKLSQTRTQPIVPQGNTVDEMLKSLQKHPLYNDQNDRRLFHHVSNEYKRAYPGDVQYDEFGKMQRPKPAIQPEQIVPFDPDGVLGGGKSSLLAAKKARSFSAVTGLINEIDQAGHPERRETTQLQDLGQNLAQSIADIPNKNALIGDPGKETGVANPVQVLMGAATGAVGKAAGRFAKGKGASPLLVGLADKGASMAAGMVPGLVGSAAGAIGDAFSGDSGGSGQSAQAQLPNKPSVSMPHVDAPSDTMIGWGTGNTAQGPTWSLNKDTHQAMDAVPSAEHAASDMFTFADSDDMLHGSESADDFRSATRDFSERIADMNDDDILDDTPVPTQEQLAHMREPFAQAKQRMDAQVKAEAETLTRLQSKAADYSHHYREVGQNGTYKDRQQLIRDVHTLRQEHPDLYEQLDHGVRQHAEAVMDSMPDPKLSNPNNDPKIAKRNFDYSWRQGQAKEAMAYQRHGAAQAPWKMAEQVRNEFAAPKDRTHYQDNIRQAVPQRQRVAYDQGMKQGAEAVEQAATAGLSKLKFITKNPLMKGRKIDLDAGDVAGDAISYTKTRNMLIKKGFSEAEANVGGTLTIAVERLGKKGVQTMLKDTKGFLKDMGYEADEISQQRFQQIYQQVIDGQVGNAIDRGIEQMPEIDR